MSGILGTVLVVCDPRGRCDRKGLLIILLVTLALQAILGLLAWQSSLSMTGPVATVIKLVFVWVAISAGVQRLHDVGLSGWWMLVSFLALLVWWCTASIASFMMLQAGVIPPNTLTVIVVLAVLYVPLLSGALWMHLAKGDVNDNRFGPVPGSSGFSKPAARELELDEGQGLPA